VTKILLSRVPSCFARHVKPLVPAVFAVVSTYQPALGRVLGYGPFFLCVIHKEGLCSSSEANNRLMLMMMKIWCNAFQRVSCITICAGPHSNIAVTALRLVCKSLYSFSRKVQRIAARQIPNRSLQGLGNPGGLVAISSNHDRYCELHTRHLLSRAPPCFGRHVKLLVPVAFAIVSTHSSFKEG
jgi:hypothetical protein